VFLAWGRGQRLLHRRKQRRRKRICVAKKGRTEREVAGSWAIG